MSEFLRILTHARRLKSATKDLSVEQLKETVGKLESIIEDRIAEEEESIKAQQERLEKIRKYNEMLASDGINPDELLGTPGEKTGKRAPRPPKYEIWNEAGERITWTGQGRMPNVFKARVDAGEEIDTFLIDK